MTEFKKDKIKLLAFDVDGTLFSSEDIISSTYQKAIETFNDAAGQKVNVPDHDTIMLQIGKPVKTIFENLLPEIPETDRNTISDSVLGLLCDQIRSGKGHLYDKVNETITRLHEKGYTLLMASNGRAPYLEAIAAVAGIRHYFQDIITIDQTTIFTKGDILKSYLEIYKGEPASLLMIGDRFSDYEAAITADSPFAFCEYGHAVPGEIPDFSIKLTKLADLLNYL